jgi:predicted dehydrogenase
VQERDPVTIAVVGCGAAAELYHAPALRTLAGEGLVRVDALVDPSAERTAALAASFPTATRVATLHAALERRVDLVLVASPARFHADQAIMALEAGAAVLCEKPMATSVAEGEAMCAAASAARRPLAVGLCRRFLPAARALRELVAAGALGRVTSATVTEGGLFRWPARSASFFDRAAGGGGVLIDVGVHVLDLLAWWLGASELVRYADDAMGGVEATCELELRWPGGASAFVRLSRDVELPNRVELRCERGGIVWDADAVDRLAIRPGGDGLALDASVHISDAADPYRFEDAFADQLRNVAAAARGDAPLVVPASEALASLRLVETCYRERELLDMPWLSPEEVVRARAAARWSRR